MIYLINLAPKFQRLVSFALSATHGADEVFDTTPTMCIAPAVLSRLKAFSDEMAQYGEAYSFTLRNGDEPSAVPAAAAFVNDYEVFLDVRKEGDEGELVEILHRPEQLPSPVHGEIKKWLLELFRSYRGFELGTFDTSILATAMKQQCYKWTDMSMGLVSDVIIIVKRFIHAALANLCPDPNVWEALSSKLSDKLGQRYWKAIESTRFLLQVKHSDTPLTLNHYFNDNLQKM